LRPRGLRVFRCHQQPLPWKRSELWMVGCLPAKAEGQHLAAAAGAARRGLIRGGRRVAPTALCPPVWGRRGQTRCVRCALSAQTVAASQTTKRALARPAPDGRTQPPRNIAPTGQRLPQHEATGCSTGGAPTPFLPRRVRSGRSAPCEAPRSTVDVAARAARFVN
jgi:hypothetical protein